MATASVSDSEDDEQRWAGWMRRAQSGDEVAYRELLSELGSAAQHFLLRRFGRQEFIEDCVQECLIAVHQARHTYDACRPFRAWFYAILRHKTIDHLRKLQHRAKEPAAAMHPVGAAITLEEQMSGGRLIAALSPQHREVLTLTKVIGLSTAEAARQLSISETAVKVRVHRAMAALKRMLEVETP